MKIQRKSRFSIIDLLAVTFAVAFGVSSCASYGAATIFIPAVIFIFAPWLALRNEGSSRAFFATFAIASLVFTVCCVRSIDRFLHYLVWDYFDPVGRVSGLAYNFIEFGSFFAPAFLTGILVCVIGLFFGSIAKAIYRRFFDRRTGTPEAAAT